MTKLVEMIIPKQYVRIQKSKTQQEEPIEPTYKISIPANDDITQLLLQIPFEKLYGQKILVKLLNTGLISDYSEEIDVKQACNLYGLYLYDDEFLEAYKQFLQLKEAKQQENYQKGIHIQANDSFSSKSQLNSYDINTEFTLENLDENVQQIKTNSLFNRIKTTLVNYLKKNDDVKQNQLFSDIYQSIHIIVIRRLISICNIPDINKIFITLLPQLQTIDDIKITSEMRQQAKEYCFNRFQFPQKQTFPIKKEDVSPKQIFRNILQVMGLNKSSYKIVSGSIESAILQYNQIKTDYSLPLQNYDIQQRRFQTSRSAKAIILSSREEANTTCYNYESKFSQSHTNNFHIPYSCLKSSLKEEKLTCLDYYSNNFFVGGRKGILSFNIGEPFQDFVDENAITDEQGNCSFKLPYIYYSRSQIIKLNVNKENILYLDDQNTLYINNCELSSLQSYCKQLQLQNNDTISVLDYNQFILYDYMNDSVLQKFDAQFDCYQQLNNDIYLFGGLYGNLNITDFRIGTQSRQVYQLNNKSPINQININQYLTSITQLNGQTTVFDIRNMEKPLKLFQTKQLPYKQIQQICKSFIVSQSKLLSYSGNNIQLYNIRNQKVMNCINLDYLREQTDVNQMTNMSLQDICVIDSQSVGVIMNNFNESYLYKIDLNQ